MPSRSRSSSVLVKFEAVRGEALSELARGARTRTQWRPCVWQRYRTSIHVAPYCNVLSNLEALDDLVSFGDWCDHVELVPAFDERDEAEMLFRFFGLVLLAWERVESDLRVIRNAAGAANDGKLTQTDLFMGFVNRIFKHRERGQGRTDTAFHAHHHHGPYLFADARGYQRALPADGCYRALDHRTPTTSATAIPLVLPSLVSAMHALSVSLRSTSSVLANPAARARVESAYGVHVFP